MEKVVVVEITVKTAFLCRTNDPEGEAQRPAKSAIQMAFATDEIQTKVVEVIEVK